MNKEEILIKIIKKIQSAIIAFSGGLDSTYLAYITYKVLGNKSLAVTAISPSMAKEEIENIPHLIKFIGIPHKFINTHEHLNKEYLLNDKLRCYYCKKELFTALLELATKENFQNILDGSNCNDLDDYRPGRNAVKEFNICSPLIEASFYKKDIRFYAKKHNLPNWNKPPTPCLASRIPYSIPITEEKLKQIEQAEYFLHKIGCKIVRVRHHNSIARIECSSKELPIIMKNKNKIIKALKSLGFNYITIDLEGYRLSGKSIKYLNP